MAAEGTGLTLGQKFISLWYQDKVPVAFGMQDAVAKMLHAYVHCSAENNGSQGDRATKC